jgi:hypothetical protein
MLVAGAATSRGAAAAKAAMREAMMIVARILRVGRLKLKGRLVK